MFVRENDRSYRSAPASCRSRCRFPRSEPCAAPSYACGVLVRSALTTTNGIRMVAGKQRRETLPLYSRAGISWFFEGVPETPPQFLGGADFRAAFFRRGAKIALRFVERRAAKYAPLFLARYPRVWQARCFWGPERPWRFRGHSEGDANRRGGIPRSLGFPLRSFHAHHIPDRAGYKSYLVMFEPNRHDVRQLLERHPVLLTHARSPVGCIDLLVRSGLTPESLSDLEPDFIVAHRLRSDCSKPGILVLSGWLTCPKSEASEPP